MSEDKKSKRPRVIKAPAVRRAELIDCAQRLFLLKGYEKTTINDVIAAAGLSKGAFYHHFRSKEDLLEAIAARFAQQGLAFVVGVQENTSLNTLQRFNALLAVSREWPSSTSMYLSALSNKNNGKAAGEVTATLTNTTDSLESSSLLFATRRRNLGYNLYHRQQRIYYEVNNSSTGSHAFLSGNAIDSVFITGASSTDEYYLTPQANVTPSTNDLLFVKSFSGDSSSRIASGDTLRYS